MDIDQDSQPILSTGSLPSLDMNSQSYFRTEHQTMLSHFEEQMKNMQDIVQFTHEDKEVECPSCLEMYPSSKTYELSCPNHHRYCYSCMETYIETCIQEECVPGCIECSADQNICYKLTSNDVRQIYSLDPNSTPESIQDAIRKFEEVLFIQYKEKNCVRCPQCETEYFLNPIDMSSSVDCHCNKCNFVFCSICLKPYHYGMTCDEYGGVENNYGQWKLNTRYPRMVERKTFYNQMTNFKQAQAEYENEKKITENNNKAFEEDEKMKASRYVLCPQCKRLIEHVSGCDMMVCGRDYHATSYKIRAGCGKDFLMKDAIPYTPHIVQKHLEDFKKALPSMKDNVQHFPGFKCSICKKNISGIRFICANCPATYLCEDCEFDRIKEHFDGKHVFKLTLDPYQE